MKRAWRCVQSAFFPLSLSYVKHVVRRQAILQRDAGEKEPMTNVLNYVLLGLFVYCWGYLCTVGVGLNYVLLGLLVYCWGYLCTVGVNYVLCTVGVGLNYVLLGLTVYCWA